jgi:hypothetical protein
MHPIEWIILIVVIGGAIIAILGLDRYRGSKKVTATGSAHPTDEMFVDQETGRRMRVWFNPETGEREYRPE